MKKFMSIAFFTIAILSTSFFSRASAEGTPDGVTPALETVCDNQTGAAYGLCNAYCEAMDCDSTNPMASESACQKVSNKYNQIIGKQLPCEDLCPLTEESDYPYFAGFVADPSTIMGCADEYTWPAPILADKYMILGAWGVNASFPQAFVQCEKDLASPDYPLVCMENTAFGGDNVTNGAIPLTLQQYEACRALLQMACGI